MIVWIKKSRNSIIKITLITFLISILLFRNISFSNSDNIDDKNCYDTNGIANIEFFVEDNKIEAGRDLILYIKTDKSIKGRDIQLEDNGTIRNNEREVVYHNKEDEYCYQYTYLTYNSSKINNIKIFNLPTENVNMYIYLKYNGKYYYIKSAQNVKTNEQIKKSENTSLVPAESIAQEKLISLKNDDVKIMKKKWADALNVSENDVEKYIDLYNAKVQGKLHKDGRKIKNENNEEVMLNGVGLFHILDYGYMYNKESLEALKYWGINCIRIPAYINYRVSNNTGDITRSERGLVTAFDEHVQEMDRIIDIASELGLYCLVDFHILEGDGDINQYQEIADKFFNHFGSKYGKQNNIIYEIANEPFGTTSENLFKYIKHENEIVKKYDNSPIILCGWTYKDSENLSVYYSKYKEHNINNVFISYHYYTGEDIKYPQNIYRKTDIPLIFSEWGNFDGNPDSNTDSDGYTNMTIKYLEWWDDNKILNCAWMLCGGNYKYSLWNHELGKTAVAIKNGCISDEYLSNYGKLVFQSYFDNNIKRIKSNDIYINRKLDKNQNEIPGKQDIMSDMGKDNTTKVGRIPNAGHVKIYCLIIGIIISAIMVLVIVLKLKEWKF